MRGETVQVLEKTKTGKTWGNAPVYEESPVPVPGVLVAPGACSGDAGQSVPDGASYSLYFPKAYEGDLDGKRVVVRGRPCRVIGSPRRYDSPNEWNMVVEAEECHGQR